MRQAIDESGSPIPMLGIGANDDIGVSDVSASLDVTGMQGGYLVCDVAINFNIGGAATQGSGAYLPADTLLPISFKFSPQTTIGVVAHVAGETGTAVFVEFR